VASVVDIEISKNAQWAKIPVVELMEMDSEPLYVEYTVKKKIDITPDDSLS
jgi:hypothetical protein